ncbi:hypothetical protein DAPPUDRAFT_343300 [Daphnia pulex]|uniref:Uncharacterized protein n=1 Tax=Daphnia pulex TaxID=6669 RepID=E9I6N6_DAPPU|nr:hypothetical protein DAPPUDRAFT_343300 [Daphnia pulex]|eukprot:EFX60344.1 hypothetical protein DAPPUDRAFT_343300 [Daphnia pulex]
MDFMKLDWNIGEAAEGIIEALNGDVSKLLIFVPGFKITGTVVGQDQLTYHLMDVGSNPETMKSHVFTFGTLISSNPWAGKGEGPCAEGKTLKQYQYFVKTTNGEIDFTVVGCEFESFGTVRLSGARPG